MAETTAPVITMTGIPHIIITDMIRIIPVSMAVAFMVGEAAGAMVAVATTA